MQRVDAAEEEICYKFAKGAAGACPDPCPQGGSTSVNCAADRTGMPTARRQQAEAAHFDYLKGPQSRPEKEVRCRMCATRRPSRPQF